ncbi:hypothetical protein AVEN_12815-1 [Araneus ventricosus]|uniref:Uncharacterized protein n=1 Tax=Araneus ventricosus TaxID=182803 RepID=A0A4Y2AD80_ARAVE|nr:hypothetical protein AVEN_12815-1 [Araneus ventricosus]
MALKESNNACNLKVSSSHLGSEGLSEKACLEELELPNSLEELKLILLKLSKDNPSSYTLFKGKYQVLMLDSLFKWHKPFGKLLKQTWVICGAKGFAETYGQIQTYRSARCLKNFAEQCVFLPER